MLVIDGLQNAGETAARQISGAQLHLPGTPQLAQAPSRMGSPLIASAEAATQSAGSAVLQRPNAVQVRPGHQRSAIETAQSAFSAMHLTFGSFVGNLIVLISAQLLP